MDLTRKTETVPDLYAIDGIAAGYIYVAVPDAAGTLVAGLAKGQHVVLRTEAGETLELTTRNEIGKPPNQKGTYLNDADLATFNDTADPKLRLYRWRDTWAKVRSGAGVVLLVPTLLGVLAAAASLFFVLSTANQPPASTIGDRALAITAWSAQPGTDRTRAAENCLLSLEGHEAPAATIPGVTCTAPVIPWWRSTGIGAAVAGTLAVLIALVAVFTLPSHYGFGKKPGAGS
jgi:hypothetical protein